MADTWTISKVAVGQEGRVVFGPSSDPGEVKREVARLEKRDPDGHYAINGPAEPLGYVES